MSKKGLTYQNVIQKAPKSLLKRLGNLLNGTVIPKSLKSELGISFIKYKIPASTTLRRNDVFKGMTTPKNPLFKTWAEHSRSIINLSFIILLLTLSSVEGFSQAVSINPTGAKPDPSAMLDVSDTTKGFLPPRLSTAQMNSISSPTAGLFVYNTDSNKFAFYNGTTWKFLDVSMATDTSMIISDSDRGTQVSVADESNIIFNTGGSESARIDATGKMGIGTNNPSANLQVAGVPPADANSANILIEEVNTGNTMGIGRAEDYGFLQTQNSEPLVLNPIGNNIGIGTSTPNKNLDVEGTFGFSGTSTLPNSVGEFDLDVSSNSHFVRDNFLIGPVAPTLRRISGGEVGQIITITFSHVSGDLTIMHDASTGTGFPIYIDGLAQDAFQLFGGYRALILVKGVNAWYLVTSN